MRKTRIALQLGWRRIWSFCQRRKLWFSNITTGPGVQIWGTLIVYNKGRITVGKNCVLRSSRSANMTGINTRILLKAHPGATIQIGDDVGMSNCIIVARDRIEIGDGTLIGADVKIFDNDFHSLYPEDRVFGQERNIKMKPVKIGKRCFIGGGAILLKGCEIGDEAVIGAGAVVSGVVGSREIWAGNPARKIRSI